MQRKGISGFSRTRVKTKLTIRTREMIHTNHETLSDVDNKASTVTLTGALDGAKRRLEFKELLSMPILHLVPNALLNMFSLNFNIKFNFPRVTDES